MVLDCRNVTKLQSRLKTNCVIHTQREDEGADRNYGARSQSTDEALSELEVVKGAVLGRLFTPWRCGNHWQPLSEQAMFLVRTVHVDKHRTSCTPYLPGQERCPARFVYLASLAAADSRVGGQAERSGMQWD